MYYGYYVPDDQDYGVVESWEECQEKTKGKYAQFKKFNNKEECEKWVEMQIGPESILDRSNIKIDAVYFDAQQHGDSVIVYVTNSVGKTLLFDYLPDRIDKQGNYILKDGRSFNFGKLTGLYIALRYAFDNKIKYIFGDSNVVLNYWSLGTYNRSKLDDDTIKLINKTFKLRQQFENIGCVVGYIKNNINPARSELHR